MRLDGVWEAAAVLLGRPPRHVEPAGRGGNSRIYRVVSEDGQLFALKSYPRTSDDPRDRLGVETGALRFLTAHGVDSVPKVAAADKATRVALFDWVEGVPVEVPSDTDLEQALAFVERVARLSDLSDAERLPLASEACLSVAELTRQITVREEKLARIEGLADLLEAIEELRGAAMATIGALELALETELPRALQRLCPADFGFHNALKQPNGRLVFVDFEYFGWDDPVKLAADFLLHPGHRLSPDQAIAARRRFVAMHPEDRAFSRRLDLLLPLYALRWALIVLNPYLHRFRDDRVRTDPGTWEAEARRRRDLSRMFLDRAAVALKEVSHGR